MFPSIDPAYAPQDAENSHYDAAQARQKTYLLELQKLRREGLELQKQDGGTLTNEHRALLQAKLDRINAAWGPEPRH